MSLNKKHELKIIAMELCRSLRKNQTEAEKQLWNIIRDKKFLKLKFYRQHPVFFDFYGKETFYILDFYCHAKRIAIELDGEYHKFQIDKDKKRDFIINNLGIKVLRFANSDFLNNKDNFLRDLGHYFAC